MKTDSTQPEVSTNSPEKSEAHDVSILVKKIFLKVEKDEEVAASIRDSLAKLYTPYLKFAQNTPNLFAIENHQARVFLSKALLISKEWKQENDSKSTFVKKIDTIVNKITTLETYDNDFFIKSSIDIEKQMSRINKRLNIKLKRLKETQLGQKKILQSKQNPKNDLIQKLKDKKIPSYIKDLLLSEWFNVLVLLNIRHSLDSEEYMSKLAFVDKLIACTQLNSVNNINENLLKDLSEHYQQGLKLVAFNQKECEQKNNDLLNIIKKINKLQEKPAKEKAKTPTKIAPKISSEKKIEKSHVKAPLVKKPKPLNQPLDQNEKLNEKKSLPVNNKKSITPKSIEKVQSGQLNQKKIHPEKTKNPQAIQDEKEIDYATLVSKLEKGTWFIILDSQNKQVKAKLSWISPISEKYLFVDSNGLKLTDTTKAELIKRLNDKSIQILKSF